MLNQELKQQLSQLLDLMEGDVVLKVSRALAMTIILKK